MYPVSYTHLDVYKRQRIDYSRESAITAGQLVNNSTSRYPIGSSLLSDAPATYYGALSLPLLNHT